MPVPPDLCKCCIPLDLVTLGANKCKINESTKNVNDHTINSLYRLQLLTDPTMNTGGYSKDSDTATVHKLKTYFKSIYCAPLTVL